MAAVTATPLLARSPEERALFNPAFIARLLHSATRDHDRAGRGATPVPFLYVIPPLALHRHSREQLPTNAATQMHVWTREHVRVLVGLPARTIALRPLVSDAICLALRHGVLRSNGGSVLPGSVRRRQRDMAATPEVDECVSAAQFLGRWFARQPDPATALALWGLRV